MKEIQVTEKGRVRVRTINTEPSLTQQQFKDECDINHIMKKYQDTGQFVHVTSKQGRYADFSDITDYQAMLDKVRLAQDAFMALPAQTRLRFQNDPGELLKFIQDKQNYDEAVKLGLVEKKQTAQNEQTQTNEQAAQSK